MKTVLTHSPEETESVGAQLAAYMETHPEIPPFLALYGDLGVGKTAFTRGFASVYAPGTAVRSPTFALVNEYKNGKKSLFHFDMYRIQDESDLESIGFYDYLDRPGVCLVEWSENIPYALPERYLRITLVKLPASPDDRGNDCCREIRFEEVLPC